MALLYSVTSLREDAVPFDEFEIIWKQEGSAYPLFNVMTSKGVIVDRCTCLTDAFDHHEDTFRTLKNRGFSDEDVEAIMYDDDVPLTYSTMKNGWYDAGMLSVDVIEIVDGSRRMKIVDLPSGAQLVYR